MPEREPGRRKGAMRRADVPPETRARLNSGEWEAVTLAESLVVDYAALLATVAPEVGAAALEKMRLASAEGVTRRAALAGAILFERHGAPAFDRFAGHASDTVRAWAAYALAHGKMTLSTRLKRIRTLADDRNAGVREWAWMALRPHVAAELDSAILLLTPWTASPSANLRRFATEITRPRGVWCAHIERLKSDPAHGLPLLEPLRADPAKYVQDSVSNWLNDASKSKPEWVRALCRRWGKASPTPSTDRICRRALRTIGPR